MKYSQNGNQKCYLQRHDEQRMARKYRLQRRIAILLKILEQKIQKDRTLLTTIMMNKMRIDYHKGLVNSIL